MKFVVARRAMTNLNSDPVSHAGLRDQLVRPRRVGLDLATQIADIHPQDVHFVLIGSPPHLAEQLTVRNYSPGILQKQSEDLILGRGE